MYDSSLLLEKLEQIDDALAKIERRFTSINSSDVIQRLKENCLHSNILTYTGPA